MDTTWYKEPTGKVSPEHRDQENWAWVSEDYELSRQWSMHMPHRESEQHVPNLSIRLAELGNRLSFYKAKATGGMANSATSPKVLRISFIWTTLCQKSRYWHQGNTDLLNLKLWPMDGLQVLCRLESIMSKGGQCPVWSKTYTKCQPRKEVILIWFCWFSSLF